MQSPEKYLGALLPVLLLLTVSTRELRAADATLTSPDGRWTVSVNGGAALQLQLADVAGKVLLEQEVGLTLADGRALTGGHPFRIDARPVVDGVVRPVAPTKSSVLRDHYRAATLYYDGGFALELRAYDSGIAYRFQTALPGDMVVAAEKQLSRFAGDPLLRLGVDDRAFADGRTFYSHNEELYPALPLSAERAGATAPLPALVHTPDNGPRLVISETALEAYPGEWLRVAADGRTLEGVWPAYPVREQQTTDRDILVLERAPEIARTSGTRNFPWRLVAVAATDGELLLNQLSYLLADASRLDDTRWIHPGKVQWDWWHDFNVWDTPFAGGVSQALYRHYIDFAAANGARYVILDEGWYVLGDLTHQAQDIDVPTLVAYGRRKNVGVILWASWATLRQQFETFMPLAERWGVAGLKVDFFQRDDQPVVEFYWKLAAEAARRHLILDFHGAHKPAGLQRTWPNVLTVEGVKGLENDKWSREITPEHDATLPFTRMVAGPMDYTPGAMYNAQPAWFQPDFHRPMSQGTRAHELAKYVVFESPLQMYADSPSAYRREPVSMQFLRAVPTVWDETRVLAAETGQVVALARRAGSRWFIGVIGGNAARALDLDLGFLPAGVRTLAVWKDGPGAARDARSLDFQPALPRGPGKLHVELAPGGGWVAIAAVPGGGRRK